MPVIGKAGSKLFASNVTLTDDGNPPEFTQWSDSELFGSDKAYLMSIDRVEDNGLTIYGKFHSDRWGNLQCETTSQPEIVSHRTKRPTSDASCGFRVANAHCC